MGIESTGVSLGKQSNQFFRKEQQLKIEKITVRAGRVVPHPLHAYGNVKCDLELVASLDEGEDPEEVRKSLQEKIESDVEQHVLDLKESLRDMQGHLESRNKIKRLESQIEQLAKERDELATQFEDLPLLSKSKSKTSS